MKLQYLFILCLLMACGVNKKGQSEYELFYPKKLIKTIDTIEVTCINWACPCPNWLPVEYLDSMDKVMEAAEEYCIFIEADEPRLKMPRAYKNGRRGNRIRLIGQYYKDKGISRDYLSPVGKLPEPAKVFRYSKVEIIKPYTIYDFSTEPVSDKVIGKEDKSYFETLD